MNGSLTARDAAHVADTLDGIDWPFRSGTFRALDFRFAFRTTDVDLARYLSGVLAPLADECPAEHVYSLVDHGGRGRGRYTLYLDDAEVDSRSSARSAATLVSWHVNRMAVEASPRFLVVHGAAVVADGGALVLAGPQEAGKTTLATALVRAGFGYLTDEAVAIDPATSLIHPYPKALSIDPGSQRLFPDLAPAAGTAPWPPLQWAVDARSIRSDAIAGPACPRAVCFVQYDPTATTSIEPVRRVDALVELVQNSFNFALHGRAGFEALVALVRAVDCYRMTSGDLAASVDLARGLVDQPVR